MALVVLLLIKVYLGARLHACGVEHWPHTEDEILALTKLMVYLILTAASPAFLSVLLQNAIGGSNKNNGVLSLECTVPKRNWWQQT